MAIEDILIVKYYQPRISEDKSLVLIFPGVIPMIIKDGSITLFYKHYYDLHFPSITRDYINLKAELVEKVPKVEKEFKRSSRGYYTGYSIMTGLYKIPEYGIEETALLHAVPYEGFSLEDAEKEVGEIPKHIRSEINNFVKIIRRYPVKHYPSGLNIYIENIKEESGKWLISKGVEYYNGEKKYKITPKIKIYPYIFA